jgi:molybdenum cofactor cytidylyltransferase
MTDMTDVAVIILAAGQSTRFGKGNKLLRTVNGDPIIKHSVQAALNAKAGEVIVVTGHAAADVEKALQGLPVTLIRNATPEIGMGTSLAVGANAIRSLPSAVMIMLGDMPLIKPETLRTSASSFTPDNGHDIVVPMYDGQRGHPVMFGAKYMPFLCALSGDEGARSVLQNHPERVRAINVDDPGTRYDIDTESDLKDILSSA